MTCKECGQVVKLTRTMNKCHSNTELSSLEETRCQFNGSKAEIKLGIDVHQDFYVVVEQVGGTNPKPPQRFQKQAFLHWAAKLQSQGGEVHAVYEACGFGFTLQRNLTVLGIQCHVVCPQKLDEQNRRVKTDGLDAKALCAIQHKGFALVDVFSLCVYYNKDNTYQWFNPRVKMLEDQGHDPADLHKAIDRGYQWGDEIPIGLFWRRRLPSVAGDVESRVGHTG